MPKLTTRAIRYGRTDEHALIIKSYAFYNYLELVLILFYDWQWKGVSLFLKSYASKNIFKLNFVQFNC